MLSVEERYNLKSEQEGGARLATFQLTSSGTQIASTPKSVRLFHIKSDYSVAVMMG